MKGKFPLSLCVSFFFLLCSFSVVVFLINICEDYRCMFLSFLSSTSSFDVCS